MYVDTFILNLSFLHHHFYEASIIIASTVTNIHNYLREPSIYKYMCSSHVIASTITKRKELYEDEDEAKLNANDDHAIVVQNLQRRLSKPQITM